MVAKDVTNKEKNEINIIDLILISDGILLKKYISSGNKLILKIVVINIRISSI